MTELEKLHLVHLELADELHRICVENNINYFIVAGTLLGAIRHEGFIPWDDDFDLGMLRNDYEKFKEVLKKELHDDYYFMDMDNNEHYSLPFIKLMKKNTLIAEGNLPDNLENYGIFIDVFPFDSVPNNSLKKQYHKITTEVYKKLLLAKNNYKINISSSIKSVFYTVLKLISKLFSNNFLKKRLNYISSKYNNEESEFITNIGGAYGYSKETIQRSWTQSLKLYDFAGRKYYSFSNYDAYLTNLYGNYMELPPVEDRGDRHAYQYIIFNTKDVQ